jgi:hypothetical protein
VTYIVNRRKPNKNAMLRALRRERNEIKRMIADLEDSVNLINEFRNTLGGRDGVERAGALYTEREDEFGSVLPRDVARYYNPHL